jgi:hypothetical protein
VEQGGRELEIAARGFADWRAKKGTGERVPEGLWTRAVEAARAHGTTTTARRLGLNHSVLKRRVDVAAPTQQFVEMSLSGIVAAGHEACVEVEDGAGFRMRLLLRGATPLEVAAAARELWRARA